MRDSKEDIDRAKKVHAWLVKEYPNDPGDVDPDSLFPEFRRTLLGDIAFIHLFPHSEEQSLRAATAVLGRVTEDIVSLARKAKTEKEAYEKVEHELTRLIAFATWLHAVGRTRYP